jgi:hypothetical protein
MTKADPALRKIKVALVLGSALASLAGAKALALVEPASAGPAAAIVAPAEPAAGEIAAPKAEPAILESGPGLRLELPPIADVAQPIAPVASSRSSR